MQYVIVMVTRLIAYLFLRQLLLDMLPRLFSFYLERFSIVNLTGTAVFLMLAVLFHYHIVGNNERYGLLVKIHIGIASQTRQACKIAVGLIVRVLCHGSQILITLDKSALPRGIIDTFTTLALVTIDDVQT